MKHLVVIALIGIGALCAGCTEDTTMPSQKLRITLGSQLGLSGSISYYGKTAQAAISLAVEDINSELGDQVTIDSILVKDTRAHSDSIVTQLADFKGRGLNIILGPQTSSELAAGKEYADHNDMLLLSPSSVARSLSVAGDNVYRFSPDDSFQAKAMKTMLLEDNLDAVIAVYRDDVWGNDLVALSMGMYRGEGGTVFDSIGYSPDGTDVSAILSTLADRVDAAVAQYGTDKVGVYLLSFGEGVQLLSGASDYPSLAQVKWYGSSAIAQAPGLLGDAKAAAFAQQVGYPCPVFGLEESLKDRWEPLKARIKASTGQEADIYSLVTYDLVWLIAKTALAAGSDDVDSFKAKLAATAAAYSGVTGNMELNETGDRKIGNFDFWGVRNTGSGAEWQRVAFYNSSTETLTRN